MKPGIGKLSDIEYLKALQSMNRVILNNAFKIIFLGAIIAVALVPVFYFNLYPRNIFWLLVFTLIIYWIGVFGVTLSGNIPLNEILDKTNLESITSEEIKTLRKRINFIYLGFVILAITNRISQKLSFMILN